MVEHDLAWVQQFHEESRKLKELLGVNCCDVFHIGSTAIADIYAKPIIDILLVVNNLSLVDSLNSEFEGMGYACMGEYGISGRRFYWKGTPAQHTFHIHLFEKWHHEVIRHLSFRDYMRFHPDVALAYSWVKRCLSEQFSNDIESYINGKESFIRMVDYRAGVAKKDQLQAGDDVVLEVYNSKWEGLGKAEIKTIKEFVDLPFLQIEHLGSTAIVNLKSKPIIDIFIALESMEQADQWVEPLESLGYLFWYGNPDKSHYRFVKGMPPCGVKRTHHVHIMQMGEDFKRRIAFKNVLSKDQELRQRYEALKSRLVKQHADNRENYTDAKTEFINKVLSEGG